mgnify:CR=1 FL=1
MDKFRSRNSHDDQGPRRSRAGLSAPARLATRILLLLALAVCSLALTQCRMVGDRLTGVSVGSFKRKSDCVKECKDIYKDAVKAERDRHTDIVRDCRGDSACHIEEAVRFQAALDTIERAYKACLYECHLQGGGTVGP